MDATSGLKFEVTAVGEANTVMVIANNYSGTTYTVPDTVKYNDVDFAVTEIVGSAFEECTSLTSVTFLGNACQASIGDMVFEGVGVPTPATLTLPATWIGKKPVDSGKKWYGGYFVYSPSALPTLFGDGVKGNKFLHNGQLIIRQGEKTYTVLGQGL